MALVQGLDSKSEVRGIKSTDTGELKVFLLNAATTAKQDEIIQALIYGVEASRFQGTTTGGSTTTLEDTDSVWEADLFKGDTVSVEIGDKRYLAEITENSANTITFGTLAEAVAADMRYWIYKRVKSVILAPETTKKIGVVGIENSPLYGPDTTTRPAADAVAIGQAFVVVADPLVVYMSDGTNWVEV